MGDRFKADPVLQGIQSALTCALHDSTVTFQAATPIAGTLTSPEVGNLLKAEPVFQGCQLTLVGLIGLGHLAPTPPAQLWLVKAGKPGG